MFYCFYHLNYIFYVIVTLQRLLNNDKCMYMETEDTLKLNEKYVLHNLIDNRILNINIFPSIFLLQIFYENKYYNKKTGTMHVWFSRKLFQVLFLSLIKREVSSPVFLELFFLVKKNYLSYKYCEQ